MIPKIVQRYCEKNKISFEKETVDEILFKAPEGYVFSTESSERLLDVGDYYDGHVRHKVTSKDMTSRLQLFRKD